MVVQSNIGYYFPYFCCCCNCRISLDQQLSSAQSTIHQLQTMEQDLQQKVDDLRSEVTELDDKVRGGEDKLKSMEETCSAAVHDVEDLKDQLHR